MTIKTALDSSLLLKMKGWLHPIDHRFQNLTKAFESWPTLCRRHDSEINTMQNSKIVTTANGRQVSKLWEACENDIPWEMDVHFFQRRLKSTRFVSSGLKASKSIWEPVFIRTSILRVVTDPKFACCFEIAVKQNFLGGGQRKFKRCLKGTWRYLCESLINFCP